MTFKIFVTVGCLGIATGLVSCHNNKAQEEPSEALQTAALQAPYDPVFYDSLRATLQTYYQLTDILTADDSSAINPIAITLKSHIDSLPIGLLQMDSTKLADITGITGSISAELVGMQGETTFEGKRASFQMVSDMLFDLIKRTGLKGDTIYHQFCPMAFDDKGAFWLSKQPGIRNPYFGKEMLTCGETKDTLIYK
ncbi:DUF3347 domain-containing protein [Chitinophaga silvatica]|uniref:DUF3347 domain-containing protein n=1 Tax=Chitinophaga silvatica TaxID=2282649 RepID=A0A3E1Y4M7_9BACT|nr:DUF3347 domain-containing protein [Chitinophaga silvatica]RFS19596.1 DUF3347 domain-containing protein [Chitinophaga silvatica]